MRSANNIEYLITVSIVSVILIFFILNFKDIIRFMGGTVLDDDAYALPENSRNGAWIWESPLNITEEQFLEQVTFAKQNNITVLYLFIEDYLRIVESTRITDKALEIEEFSAKLRQLIRIANDNGVEIEALAGDVDWAESSHEYIPVLLLDYVLKFNENPQYEEKFAGLQFDIEFYNQREFTKDKERYSINFLNLVDKLADQVAAANQQEFILGFAISHSLDTGKGTVPPITYNQERKSAYEHLLDILYDTNSYLVIMAYRNFATGTNGSIELSTQEVEWAEEKGGKTQVIIGQETIKNEVERITFYGLSAWNLTEAAEQIHEAFFGFSKFSGIAIHTLPGFIELVDRDL
jgi:hypothetical protein